MWALRIFPKHKQTEKCEGKALSVGKYPKRGCLAGAGWSAGESHGGADNLEDS